MISPDAIRFDALLLELAELSADTIDAIAASLARVDREHASARLGNLVQLVPTSHHACARRLLQLWIDGAGPAGGDDLGTMLRVAGAAFRKARALEHVSLVWTCPEKTGSTFRRTDMVWLESIDGAERDLWLASYSTFPSPELGAALARAIDRGVRLSLVLERRIDNPILSNESWQSLPDRVLKKGRLLCWPVERRKELGGTWLPAMHAKFVVADDRIAFVTSANLSGNAFERNIEVGMKLEGGPQPSRLTAYLEAMVRMGEFVPFKP